MNPSFSNRLGANSTETLIATFHPTLSPFVAKAMSQLEPEYGPGSIEYEVAVNFLKHSAGASISKPSTTLDRSFISTKCPQEDYTPAKESTWGEYEKIYMDCSSDFEKTTILPLRPQVPLGSLLFLFGFLLMPCWWIGAIFPRGPVNKIQQKWRLYNQLMSIISGIILVFGIGTLIWYLK